jgi:hypothetical protein
VLTQERLKELLSYDPETGLFRWIKKPAPRANRVKIGAIAGCKEKAHGGYILIGIDGVLYGAHRLAWLYVHGYLPDEVDHESGKPWENWLENLRECTHSQNLKNVKKPSHNTSGFKGVHLHAETGKWRARICVEQKYISLGLHATKEQAHAAYREGAVRYHGEFARFE